MKQVDRVLEAMRKAGAVGVSQADFYSPTCDGGKPIARLAARVKDLRDAGHKIETAGERSNFAVYVLREGITPEQHVRMLERDDPTTPVKGRYDDAYPDDELVGMKRRRSPYFQDDY